MIRIEENFNKKLRDLVNYNKEVDVLEENAVVVLNAVLVVTYFQNIMYIIVWRR